MWLGGGREFTENVDVVAFGEFLVRQREVSLKRRTDDHVSVRPVFFEYDLPSLDAAVDLYIH